ncbi:hypothetical protein [Streptomyces cyaneofuscatus]|uniref:hypothetical protein n=1 Tax=Streptomyces cyaneofuscatus TaxID=66883 RepID=UPI00381A679F
MSSSKNFTDLDFGGKDSTAEEMAAFAVGLTIPEPGLGPITRWYPEGETGPDVIQWGYVAHRQH